MDVPNDHARNAAGKNPKATQEEKVMSKNPAEFFNGVFRKRRYVLYVPEDAMAWVRDKTADAVECPKLPPGNSPYWGKFPPSVHTVVADFRKFKSKEGPFPEPDLTDPALWKKLCEAFLLEKENGYISLPNGTVIEFRSFAVHVGKPRTSGGCVYTECHPERGSLVILERSHTGSTIMRLMRLMRERLHRVRRTNPEEIVAAAKLLGILKAEA